MMGLLRAAQIPKRHIPIVGLIGLLIIVGSGATIGYYQFVVPHNTTCGGGPVQRVFFMNAVIQDLTGFTVVRELIVQNGTIPVFNGPGQPNMTGIKYQEVSVKDPKTISVNVGDSVTLYVRSIHANSTLEYSSATGHGLEFDAFQILDTNIPWGNTHTYQFKATSAMTAQFQCAQFCSGKHQDMKGSYSAACGA